MPKHIFLSYKRNVDPDQPLATQLFKALADRGHHVFIDRTLRPGQNWSREIEANIRKSDFLIVLLSEASSLSEAVRSEIDIARDHATQTGRPEIIPVRVKFTGKLPYALSIYLDPIQYAVWKNDSDTPALLDEFEDTFSGSQRKKTLPFLDEHAQGDGAMPQYAAALAAPGGGLDAEDGIYVSRAADATATSALDRAGQTICIKGPRQMGKTSLLIRLCAKAVQKKRKLALLDFQLLDAATRSDRFDFFRNFLSSMIEQLDIENKVDAAFEQINALRARLEQENAYLRSEVSANFAGIIGVSPAMKAVQTQSDLVAATDSSVLIEKTGERFPRTAGSVFCFPSGRHFHGLPGVCLRFFGLLSLFHSIARDVELEDDAVERGDIALRSEGALRRGEQRAF